jgi:hypothetical protein
LQQLHRQCRLQSHNKLPICLRKTSINSEVLGAPSQVCVFRLSLQATSLQSAAANNSDTASSQTSSHSGDGQLQVSDSGSKTRSLVSRMESCDFGDCGECVGCARRSLREEPSMLEDVQFEVRSSSSLFNCQQQSMSCSEGADAGDLPAGDSDSGDGQLQISDSGSRAGSLVSRMEFCDFGDCRECIGCTARSLRKESSMLEDVEFDVRSSSSSSLFSCQQQSMSCSGAADAGELPAGASSAAQEPHVSSSCSSQTATGELCRSLVMNTCTQKRCVTGYASPKYFTSQNAQLKRQLSQHGRTVLLNHTASVPCAGA